jgi:hypothetical protein
MEAIFELHGVMIENVAVVLVHARPTAAHPLGAEGMPLHDPVGDGHQLDVRLAEQDIEGGASSPATSPNQRDTDLFLAMNMGAAGDRQLTDRRRTARNTRAHPSDSPACRDWPKNRSTPADARAKLDSGPYWISGLYDNLLPLDRCTAAAGQRVGQPQIVLPEVHRL